MYGPGLYYHDVEEEQRASEHSQDWGKLDEKATAKFIERIGGDIASRISTDSTGPGRALEVKAFVECFSNVLPHRVKEAYDRVVADLEKAAGSP